MGMIACYMEADRDLIDRLKMESADELFEEIEELDDAGELETYDMDKMWDGLHFILSGVSATAPIEGNLLSEAVVGTAMFSDDESADFISYIYPERVNEISDALNDFDIDNALSDFSPRVLAGNGIYPTAIWIENEKDSLKEELVTAFNDLKEFFTAMSDDHKGIIVSIY